ncbi:acyclic terpene utilization AtuA family protein [Skermanella pratensis]|uniref:acyclic terpene utilization AtuA family protein n=1 Tax=Skermanella pratensis TaxID=2233999 RepID=UPI0031B5BB30
MLRQEVPECFRGRRQRAAGLQHQRDGAAQAGFGWKLDGWDRIGQGTVIGHLLECAGRITGGYFADSGREVEAMLTNGPAGGGGARGQVRETVGIVSNLVGRSRGRPEVTVIESAR